MEQDYPSLTNEILLVLIISIKTVAKTMHHRITDKKSAIHPASIHNI